MMPDTSPVDKGYLIPDVFESTKPAGSPLTKETTASSLLIDE